MDIKFFIYGVSEPDAKRKLVESFNEFSDLEFTVLDSEKYWKLENVYIFNVKSVLSKDNMDSFLNLYADNWIKIGNPVEEYIASDNDENTTYIREDFVMIQVFA